MSNNNTPGMTVEQGNKLIAEFMEHTGQSGEVKFYVGPDGFEHESGNYLKYHSSWDWLMPVVENIKEIEIEDFTMKWRVMKAVSEVKRDSIWKEVVHFIQWYNTQTPQP